MPSLQSRISRLMMKRIMGDVFRHGRSIPEWRAKMAQLSKYQKIPDGTENWPVMVHDMTAEWVSATGAKGDRAILYLHGGAFVVGSAANHRELAAWLSEATRARILLLNYRLAPEHPFPAALEDTVAAYHWLLAQGYTADRLAIGGDSAGGGLALKSLLALREAGSTLPAAAIFLSPQTDWVRFDGESYTTRASVDPINSLETSRFSAGHYVGDSDPGTPLLNPTQMDLSGLPPVCIHVGDDEVLLSDAVRLAEKATASSVDVAFKVWPGMWHVFQLNARFVPEARQSITEMGNFILRHFNPANDGAQD